MQLQYDQLKKKHPDCILFFRLGDFYEGFDEDAKVMAKELGIVLTSRQKGKNKRPMAGIPHHALNRYLHKMIKAGYKVAIAEQVEDAEDAKGVVERDVVRIVTPGTVTDDTSLNESLSNYLVAINKIKEKDLVTFGIAVCDLSTGEFWLNEFYSKKTYYPNDLINEITRINPSEILISNESPFQILKEYNLQQIENYEFDYDVNKKRILSHFKIRSLKSFGIEKYKSAISSAGVIINYLQETQKTNLEHITSLAYKNLGKYMILDECTIRNLELVTCIQPDSKTSLLSTLNHCKTPMGQRKLYSWIIRPLIDKQAIQNRLDSVENLAINSIKLSKLTDLLNNIYDIERILGKIGTERANARDLLMLKDSLYKSIEIANELKGYNVTLIKEILNKLSLKKDLEDLITLLEKSIEEDPPPSIMEGEIIKKGYDKDLDELKKASKEGKDWIKNLQVKEAKRTNIPSLKVKYNKVFGYYIEVSKANLDKVPDDYVRKQTLVNAERFITPELKEMEEKILGAEEKQVEMEYDIFLEIRSHVASLSAEIQKVIDGISTLDCLVNFANLARLNNYVKPEIDGEDKGKIEIKNGRHPVVEKISDDQFVPNDTYLNDKDYQLEIITGPNMSGKSTFIRQVALIVLMAQIGCFVPADSFRFCLVDRIFTRVGASDNLARGESTFMVEMIEVANIINNATDRSLIILDEVGRGTSTYDGVAIAWAVAEFIHNNIKSKTLFATHYHELIQLQDKLKRVKNFNVAVKESRGKVVFLRKIEEGGTDKSYGVHVAELAGVPKEVVKRANEILGTLQQENMLTVKHVETELVKESEEQEVSQIPLLTKLPENPIIKELKKVDINKMTPMEALKKLDELVKSLK